jgi:hypothetical protein
MHRFVLDSAQEMKKLICLSEHNSRISVVMTYKINRLYRNSLTSENEVQRHLLGACNRVSSHPVTSLFDPYLVIVPNSGSKSL